MTKDGASIDRTISIVCEELASSTSPTRRLQKQRHETEANKILKLPKAILDSKKLVSMDECKEMMGIEKEYGSCLFSADQIDLEIDLVKQKARESNKYWQLLFEEMNTRPTKFADFLQIIESAAI